MNYLTIRGQLEKCELNTLRWRLFGRAAVWSRAGGKPTLKLAVRGAAHLALHLKRRVNTDNQIDFLGRSWHISPTKRLSITLIHHPLRQFWAVTQPPSLPLNNWPEILGNYSL